MSSEWHQTFWGEISTLHYGKRLSNYKNKDGKYNVYASGGIVGTCDQYLCPKNGIIVGRKGNLGFHYSEKAFFVIDTAFWLETSEIVDEKWSYYKLVSEDISYLDSGSAIPSMSRETFYSLPVLLPSLHEQKKIAEILTRLENKIELNQKKIETLEEIAKALFKSWFIDFDPVRAKSEGRSTGLPEDISELFPDSFEESELGKIPRGWFCSTFSKFMNQKKEKIGQRKATILSAINSGELVPSDKYFKKKVYSKDTSKYIAVDKYDFAYNPSRINIGSIGILCDDYLGAVSPIYNVVTPNPGWHWYSLMSIKRDYFNKNVQVLASGSVRQSLSIDDFLSISVVTPPSPNSLVSYFNKVFDLFFKKQNNLNEERRILENIYKTILPKLISGELRIPDAEKKIEEVGI